MASWNRLQHELNGLAISRGDVPGYTPIYKNAHNFSVSTTDDPQTVWTYGGLYPWSALDTPQTIYIQSDNAADVGTVFIEGMGPNKELQTELASINGTTTTTTTQEFTRINEVTFVSSTQAENLGNITLRTVSGAGTVVGHIQPTYGISLTGIYSVPANHMVFVNQYEMIVQRNEGAEIFARARIGGVGQFYVRRMDEIFQANRTKVWSNPVPFEEKTDVDIRIDNVTANNMAVTVHFELTLVHMDYIR